MSLKQMVNEMWKMHEKNEFCMFYNQLILVNFFAFVMICKETIRKIIKIIRQQQQQDTLTHERINVDAKLSRKYYSQTFSSLNNNIQNKN